MRKKLLMIIFLLGLSVALLGNPSPSEAGTIIVDGNCTLVDAVIAANTDAPSGQCPAGSGDDVISLTVDVQFTEAYPGSTNIGGGQAALPDITSNITIEGNGHTIVGGRSDFPYISFRLTNVVSSANLEINNVDIDEFVVFLDNGDVRGGILYIETGANVILRDDTVRYSSSEVSETQGFPHGGLAYNLGSLTVQRLSIFNVIAYVEREGVASGGVFYNSGTMSVADTFFSVGAAVGNSASANTGGAIYSDGVLNVERCLFAEGGVLNYGGDAYGGAIAIEGQTSIANSTFIRNVVQGDFVGTQGYGGAIAINTSDPVSISHSTFLDHDTHGGTGELIYVISGLPTIEGSIIASSGYDYPVPAIAGTFDGADCFGPMTGSGNLTLAGDTSCSAISSGTIELDTHVSTMLADNGGPTKTLALLPVLENPAVDGNPNCGLVADQRGYQRDINCDIGAFELNGIGPTPTPVALTAVGACIDGNLAVSINSGDSPYEITASGGGNVPVAVGIGTHIILGPDKWDNLTVTEQSGDGESINLGQFKCRTDERPVPLLPAHRSRTTDPFPTFSWSSISFANNYRVFVFDDKVTANRTVDIRQNSGGPTTMILSTPLTDGRLFWRVRGRQNRVWSLWSVRFTLFKDPQTVPISGATPVPTLELSRPTTVPLPTMNNPDSETLPTPESVTPTLIPPPNSR